MSKVNDMISENPSAGGLPNRTPPSRRSFYSALLLPEEPLVKIRPSKSWVSLDVAELWVHRELLCFLIWRDLKARYKHTILGSGWVILQPLLMTLVFTVVLTRIMRVPSLGVPYPLFLYAGLLPWTFFSNGVLSGSHSLVGSGNLITKVYFSRMIIPIAAIGVRLVDLLIASTILIALMIYYGTGFSRNILMLPLLVAQITVLALGLSIAGSAFNVKYRDVGTVLPVLLQLCLFVSPVVYSSSLVPQRWKWIYDLNPLTGIIEGFRSSLFGFAFNWYSLAASAAISFGVLVASMQMFRRMEDEFADTV